MPRHNRSTLPYALPRWSGFALVTSFCARAGVRAYTGRGVHQRGLQTAHTQDKERGRRILLLLYYGTRAHMTHP